MPSFRRMDKADLKAVVEIEREANPIPWSEKQLTACLQTHDCWVYSEGDTDKPGAVIAYAIVSSVLDESSLLNLCVSIEKQGQGFGRTFLEYLLKQARAQNRATYFLEVRISNKKALRLYESLGFKEIGLRKDYYPALEGREDALTYSLAV